MKLLAILAALALLWYLPVPSSNIGIIGGADGPTTIVVTTVSEKEANE